MTGRLGWRPATTLILSLVGLGLSIFLTWGHYFDQGAITNSCHAISGHGGIINCGLVTTGSWSSVLGIPVAVYGLVFFVFMTGINTPWAWRSPSVWIARLRVAAAVAGVFSILFLVGIEAFVKRSICIYCTGVHLVTFALFLVIASGWQDTGWARFVAAYEEEQDGELDGGYDDEIDEAAGADFSQPASRKTPRPPRSERKHAGSRR